MSLVGENFTTCPYLSPIGRLYRLSRLNSLTLSQIASVLHVSESVMGRLRRGEYLPWADTLPWDGIATVSHPMERKITDIDEWYPFRLARRSHQYFDLLNNFRACRTCLAHGYHSVLHQLPWLQRCPWHEEDLIETCMCGAPLLPAPKSLETRLLRCSCGIDHFDVIRTLSGSNRWDPEQIITLTHAYLDDAKSKRRTHTLISGLDPPLELVAQLIAGAENQRRQLVDMRPNQLRIVASYIKRVSTGDTHHHLSQLFVEKSLQNWNDWEQGSRAKYSSFALTPSNVLQAQRFANVLSRALPSKKRDELSPKTLLRSALIHYDGQWSTRPGILGYDELYVGILLLEGLVNSPHFRWDPRLPGHPCHDQSLLPAADASIAAFSRSPEGQLLTRALCELVTAGTARHMVHFARREAFGEMHPTILADSNMALVTQDRYGLEIRLGHFLHHGSRVETLRYTDIYERILLKRPKDLDTACK